MSAVSPLLFRLFAAEYSATGPGSTVTLATDVPGDSLAPREFIQLPSTNGERRVIAPIPLQGTTRGRIYNVTVTAAANLVVYRIGFYVRRLGRTPSDWAWHWISVVPTGDAWDTIKVPVPGTAEEWATIHAPVPATPEEWATVEALPKTSTDLHMAELPMDDAA